jgi:tetratricopeptide (TPR) repeat protein
VSVAALASVARPADEYRWMTSNVSGQHPRAADLVGALTDKMAVASRSRIATKVIADCARILTALGRHSEAVALLSKASAMPAGSPADDEALGFAAFEAGQHGLSRAFYARVVERVPNDALARYNLATADRNIGRLDAAEDECDMALAIEPDLAQAALLRANLRSQTPSRNHIDELRDMLTKTTAAHSTTFLHYALGKELDDLGEYAAAFDHFSSGAALRRSALSYDVRRDAFKLSRISETFSADRVSGAAPLELPAYGFIIGLPRSGTTLVERILTSGDHARSNGETDNLFGALQEGASEDSTDIFEQIAATIPERAQAAYARRAGPPKPGHVVLEKLPFNFLYAGAIRLAFPTARTLLVRRAPADNCFAMYSTLFGNGYPFSYDLREIVEYYAAYRALMSHWRSSIGEQWSEVAYEDLVGSPNDEAPALAAHFRLPWKPEMTKIEANDSPSATASAAQVRQPIYKRARGRWRHYEQQLRPLLDGLEQAGVDPYNP